MLLSSFNQLTELGTRELMGGCHAGEELRMNEISVVPVFMFLFVFLKFYWKFLFFSMEI